jgi:hypothetical protein
MTIGKERRKASDENGMMIWKNGRREKDNQNEKRRRDANKTKKRKGEIRSTEIAIYIFERI